MELNIKVNIFKVIQIPFIIACLVLFLCTLVEYRGSRGLYLLFSLVSNYTLYLCFCRKKIFFDTFWGLLLWLGFWFKFSICYTFLSEDYGEPLGLFTKMASEYDHALVICIIGFLAVILSSLLRRRLFNYEDEDAKQFQSGFKGIELFYFRYRYFCWFLFLVVMASFSILNIGLGIYQRGAASKGTLPPGVKGLFTWFLLFGGASVSALFIEMELRLKKTKPLVVFSLSILEAFLSATSMLSRGMVLNMFSLFEGTKERIRKTALPFSHLKGYLSVLIFITFFVLSYSSVENLRYLEASGRLFKNTVTAKSSDQEFVTQKVVDKSSSLNISSNSVKVQFDIYHLIRRFFQVAANRWVGIDAILVVSSYDKLSWSLWKIALKEKYDGFGNSFYDKELKKMPRLDNPNHHTISMPGIMGLLYYSGSLVFVFVGMALVSFFGSLVEICIFRFSGQSLVLCSLFSQVVAYRFTHFGYVPARSYLLFGAILFNLIIFVFTNYALLKFYSRKGHPN